MSKKLTIDNKLFFLILGITFTIFIFTTDAHRYTIDEDAGQQQTQKLVTQIPDPNYVQGQSVMQFNYPFLAPYNSGPTCQNAILCYPTYIGYSFTEIPFFAINHYFHIVKSNTLVLTSEDFNDPNYVFWRNSQDPDFTFLELFYGPTLSALTVGVFFLTCRAFNFEIKTSIMLSLLYGLSTTIWAYSKTSLNVVPEALFIIISLFLFRKFQNTQNPVHIILCAASLGFAFLVRPDAILVITPLFLFLFYVLRRQNQKLKKLVFFIAPIASSYLVYKLVFFLRVGVQATGVSTVTDTNSLGGFPYPMAIFGLLLSPGVGLLIFSPILLTVFLAFPDFYKKNKQECLLFLSIIIYFLYIYGTDPKSWHGLIAWGARYLLIIIPFFLIPLGASIEMRKSLILNISLFLLGIMGVFFNLVYMVQDVSRFVWTYPGSHSGLFGLATPHDPLYISPVVLWTFEHSQLTQSIITAFTQLQPDIFLLKLLGPIFFASAFIAIITSLTYLLFRVLKEKQKAIDSVESFV